MTRIGWERGLRYGAHHSDLYVGRGLQTIRGSMNIWTVATLRVHYVELRDPRTMTAAYSRYRREPP